MTLAVRFEESVYIPSYVEDFGSFRHWVCSADFPERGRIDFLEGTIEVDMSAEELHSHGALKAELARWLLQRTKEGNLGPVYLDSARLNCPSVGLSCEPDIIFVSWSNFQDGSTRYQQAPDRWVEIEGSATLVVEVVSDSSVGKDLKRLPPLYAKAGIPEFWRADARGRDIQFEVFHLKDQEYVAAPPDEEGFLPSLVTGRRIRLRRDPGPLPGFWQYTLEG
ncbi:MAG TPA: Uma2 family endonuclease [Candidatus Xenobia bacterium]|jgi:Uma2 family endonuclease